jgi:glucose/arabinose dehydrogenase
VVIIEYKDIKMRFSILLVALVAFCLQLTNAQLLQLDSTELTVQVIAENLDTPWEILWGPDDMIWMTERKGLVSRIDPETGNKEVLLDIIEIVDEGLENGLLGMALHPNFEHPDSQFVYLVYTIFTQSRTERLVRYTFDSDTLIDELILLDGIDAALNHTGSRLQILPDRTILMSTGDAGSSGVSQDTLALAGKILRINLDGSVPEDNPIPDSHVWSIGHRNPQGLVRAPNGIIYSSEHGPSNDDEINIIEKDRNYGWPDVMGFCDLSAEQTFCTAYNVAEPIAAWTPTLAVCGLDYYDHDAIPEWKNTLLLTTLKARRVVALKLSQDGRSVLQEEEFFHQWWGRLRDICISPDGRVFIAVSNADGRGTIQPGDDRIVEILSLNVIEYCNNEQFATICPGETYNFYGLEISQPGTYVDTIPGGSECDTIITLQLVIAEGYNIEDEIEICDGDSAMVNGKYLSKEGVYVDTLLTIYGCDSIVSTWISYFDSGSIGLEDSVMMALDDTVTLTANEGFISYKWNDNTPSQDNTITIIASELGIGTHFYTIEVEHAEGCIFADTVSIIITPVVGIEKYAGLEFSVYPNPVTGDELNIDYTITSEAVLIIYNQVGMEVSRKILSPMNKSAIVSLPELSGLYYLRINSSEGTGYMKVIKQ